LPTPAHGQGKMPDPQLLHPVAAPENEQLEVLMYEQKLLPGSIEAPVRAYDPTISLKVCVDVKHSVDAYDRPLVWKYFVDV
jgi:hypothetical protein